MVVCIYADGRGGKHVARHLERFSGIVQVNAYAGYNILEKPNRSAGPIKLAFCWTHLRRRFYEFHKSTGSPIANEAMERIGRLYAIEKKIRGFPAKHSQIVRNCESRPIIDDGRIELDTNVLERAIRPIALTRKKALFAGSDRDAEHWVMASSIIETCRLNHVEPFVYLKDVLKRMVSGQDKANQIDQIMPWNWQQTAETPVLDKSCRSHHAYDASSASDQASVNAALTMHQAVWSITVFGHRISRAP